MLTLTVHLLPMVSPRLKSNAFIQILILNNITIKPTQMREDIPELLPSTHSGLPRITSQSWPESLEAHTKESEVTYKHP